MIKFDREDDFYGVRDDLCYVGVEATPKFYLKYRKLNEAVAKKNKLSKIQQKKNFIPPVLLEFEKRRVLPLKSGIIKLKGYSSELNAK